MATVTLKVNSTTTDAGPPRIIVFKFKKPYPPTAFLAVLTLTENTSLGSINGRILPGSDASHPGSGNADLPSSVFTPIWNVAPHSNLSVTLIYNDGTGAITSISVTDNSPAAVGPTPP